MDSIIKFASGLSTVENYAHDVYIKSNLTIELDKVINQIMEENRNINHPSADDINIENRYITETPTVMLFCDLIEAVLLHGLKEKLSTTVSNVFSAKSRPKNLFCLDFWPIIKILSHNEESKHLKRLTQISTDVGRCRAWIRLSLNECLLRSYLDSLICDSSCLNSFYRSSAYLRDSQHTDMMKNLLSELDPYIFHLNADNVTLNIWSSRTLDYLGVMIQNEDSFMVATALDAIHLISDNKIDKPNKRKNKSLNIKEKAIINSNLAESSFESDEPTEDGFESDRIAQSSLVNNQMVIKNSDTIDIPIRKIQQNDEEEIPQINVQNDDMFQNERNDLYAGNSLSMRSGWSTQPMILDESYNALLESYSTRAVLSSTPDISEIKNSILTNANNTDCTLGTSLSENDFEIIPKNLIGNDDTENKKFFEQSSKLSHEHGLDEQDYKCHHCSRPIGMIYGKCMLCRLDGHLYCIDCHGCEESLVPAQIIYNWCFKKFPVAKQNKNRLMVIENEPIFDLKILSPNLYAAIPEMKEILNLRTQLFFLHAYLFTCQEHIALKMRKLVWPREHLFEHIHLYSINDLQQIYNNVLATTLRQVITFAKKHIAGCNLCKLKGFYCEICKNSEILYPFDTDSTKRCDKCKSVFHIKCYDEKYDKNNCSKCLRIAKKRGQQQQQQQQLQQSSSPSSSSSSSLAQTTATRT
ncbi:duf4206 and run domain containing protein [Dermatophagoides farinae]|uniref:Duf4206 and run domain containing protein n=1 Tax=Dermatophagoides farinae TaxID=6954 RepID=A0A9D4P7V9_DERFA|nr:pleckstrin homology domain-containing family M member 3-like [Dermatophagoides farinae]KAH7646410.1 duf4206 and run domain containing protein [Dermatophagoides farinae]